MKFTPRVQIFFRFIAFHWFILVAYRVLFFLVFKPSTQQITDPNIWKALYLGVKFDLRLTMWILLPLLLLSWLPYINIRSAKTFWTRIYGLFFLLLTSFFAVDLGYYAYLNARINSSVITYFYNPLTSFGMAWQNYPMVTAILALIGLTYIYVYSLKKYIFNQSFAPLFLSRSKKFVGGLVFAIVFIAGLYGKWSYYPLRWSEAFFTGDKFVSALALNPVLYLAKTMRHRVAIYDKEIVANYYDDMAAFLGVPEGERDKEKLNFSRSFSAEDRGFGFVPNVVVIVMESYASYKTSLMDNPHDAGPVLSNLAREGVYFSEYYVPVEGTARSMFALMTGVPDVSQHKTASRNPLIIQQNVIMNALQGYSKYYFNGGSANWGNIRGVFSNNIDGIEIMEEGRYDSGRTDVWGLSDLDLFREAAKVLDRLGGEQRPFAAVIQAASYHRPYTIPEDAGDFKWVEKTKKELEEGGFISNQEYNSFRFADYSLGEFFRLVENQAWFDNTLFVITGDHGVPDNNSPSQTVARRKLETAPFHVPLVFFNKKMFPEARVENKPAAEPDVWPSIAGILGLEYINLSMGRDLFNPIFDDERYAFTYTYHRLNEYGLIGDGVYLKSKQGRKNLYRLGDAEELEDISEEESELFQRMSTILEGKLHTSRYMLYFNKPAPLPSEVGIESSEKQ
ncbi:MAG: LTA synthase family protein [Bdellovibrionales bacterium]